MHFFTSTITLSLCFYSTLINETIMMTRGIRKLVKDQGNEAMYRLIATVPTPRPGNHTILCPSRRLILSTNVDQTPLETEFSNMTTENTVTSDF